MATDDPRKRAAGMAWPSWVPVWLLGLAFVASAVAFANAILLLTWCYHSSHGEDVLALGAVLVLMVLCWIADYRLFRAAPASSGRWELLRITVPRYLLWIVLVALLDSVITR